MIPSLGEPRPHRVSSRNPFEIYFLFFTALIMVPVAVGAAPRPGSINSFLDPTFAKVWAILLAGGAIVALAGIVWPQHVRTVGKVSTTGLVIEQLGLVMTSGGCVLYAGALLWSVKVEDNKSALLAIALVAAFGLACFTRARQIQKQFRDEQHQQGE